MTLDEAKALLNTLHRDELVDYAFSDAEVYWLKKEDDEDHVAFGYFSRDGDEVSIYGEDRKAPPTIFTDAEARQLRSCSLSETVSRNDSGPR